jgi:succinoglycan biosynthesis protein ExoV
MKIYYWNVHPNFGDLINPWLWPKVFPTASFEKFPKKIEGVADAGSDTLLNHNFPRAKSTLILGSGVGYGEPANFGAETKIYCVRGPLSAKKLSLPKSFGIIDPGILLNKYVNIPKNQSYKFSFMPQISSVLKGPTIWKKACQHLGFGYIDPRDSVDETVQKISQTGTLLTEAMHGAIAAEAFRVPWIPIVTRPEILSFKWQDWCNSIEIDYKPVKILPLEEKSEQSISRRIQTVATYPVAITQLRLAALGHPNLASDAIIDNRIARLEEVFDLFQNEQLSN